MCFDASLSPPLSSYVDDVIVPHHVNEKREKLNCHVNYDWLVLKYREKTHLRASIKHGSMTMTLLEQVVQFGPFLPCVFSNLISFLFCYFERHNL